MGLGEGAGGTPEPRWSVGGGEMGEGRGVGEGQGPTLPPEAQREPSGDTVTVFR